MGFLFWIEKKDGDKKAAELRELNREATQEEENQKEILNKKKLEASFYQKLSDGFDTNILIVGDSIGEGSGVATGGKQWFKQLQVYLQNYKGSKVSMTNVSMGGNTSYAGYVRTMALDDNIDYDLAIICYGQNDSLEGFSVNYESIIRAIESKYPNCSIISILESSQREYTEKMKVIQAICAHYDIPMADTIASFSNSGKKYEDLTKDGVHPNDVGQDIYYETIKNIIDNNIKASTGKMKNVKAINKKVYNFDNFKWYDANNDFKRVDDTTFILEVKASGILGIDYIYESGTNKADIYIDDKKYKSPTVIFDYDYSQRHIMIVNDDCTVKKKIKVVFDSKNQADGFKGMCFSWK